MKIIQENYQSKRQVVLHENYPSKIFVVFVFVDHIKKTCKFVCRCFSAFVAISGIYIEISPIGFDKMVIIFHRIMEMPQNFQETCKTKLY